MPYDTGGEWDEDGYAASPAPVSPPVSPGVSPAASRPAAPLVAVVVSPAGSDGGGPGNEPPLRGVGRWEPAPGEPDPGPGAGARLRGALAAAAGIELLGGGPGGLLAELADPHPETMRQHLEHVAGHPWRPEGPWGGAAFTAGHLAVTGPTKAAGKFLTAAGTALVFAGTRIDWAGDRFTRNVIPVLTVLVLIVIVLAFT